MEQQMARTGAATANRQAESYRGLCGWLSEVDKLGELRRVAGDHWNAEMGGRRARRVDGGQMLCAMCMPSRRAEVPHGLPGQARQ
jgi:hypothetical protein